MPDLQSEEIRILMLEGDEDDVILQQRTLKKSGLSFLSKWVVTREDFIRELTNFKPDIILSDYILPAFDGISALSVVQLMTPDIPFIFVTGRTGEELAIEMFKRGAFNYVLKTNLSKLGPAVKHAIKHGTSDVEKQAKLKDSEARYRRLFETAQDGILILNASTGQIDDVNPYLMDMLGYSHEEFLGKRLWEIGAFKDTELAKQAFVELQEKEYIRYEDLPLETESGEVIDVEFVSNIYLINGKKVIQCDIRDITKRKQAETGLEKSESRFRLLTEKMSDLLWMTDLEMNGVYVSPSVEAILGFTPDEYIGKPIQEKVTPESVRRSAEIIAEEFQHDRERDPDRSYVIDLEFYHKDGSVRDMETSLSFFRYDSVNPVGIHGLSRDITERKKAESALAESEAKFREFADNLPEVAFEADSSGRFVYANANVPEVLGYTEEELYSGSVNVIEMLAEEDRERAARKMQRILTEGPQDSGEYMARKKDGSLFPVIISTLPVTKNGITVGVRGVLTDLTAQKEAEESLRASEERYRSYIEVTGQLGWTTNANGEVEEDIPAWRNFTGQNYEEVKGQGWGTAIHPHDFDHAIEEWSKAIAVKSIYDVEYRVRRYDGVYRYFLAHGVPVLEKDGSVREWVGTCIDITERKEAEAALLKLEGELYAALNTLPDLMFEVDSGGLIHDYHSPQTDLLYVPPEDFVGKTVEEVLPENASKAIMEAISEVVNTQDRGYATYFLEMPDGTHWYELSIAPKGNTDSNRLVALVRDITERRSAEEATERHSRELELANKELESFSYSVSHDLRAPLRAVKGFGKMLFAEHLEELDEEGKRLLDIIISNTEAMEGLIEGLLALSGINREDLRAEKLDMISLAKDCIGELDVEGRDVEFIVGDLPSAEGGCALVRQVFLNLISNAVKFTGKKEKAVIEIGSETQNGQDVYFVKDNGDGFDMRHSDNLFGVFKRLHKEDEFPGLGIGLATVQRIINLHGGKVWAEGKKGEGATFYFFLPVQEVRWKKNSVS